ncbi:MAG TPA: response regulator transcription factor [Chitinophagaceae bacterium]|nr:response regulator transcription factor [Chitinophagaceae bacterium]
MPIKVIIVEDDADIRQSLEDIIASFDDINCVAGFPNAEEFIDAFKYVHTDVVLMDIGLPGKNGIATVAQMKPLKPKVQYLMCTSYEEPEKTFESLCAGATGYLLKNCTPEKLHASIREIYNGGSPMSPQIARLVVSSFTRQQKASEDYESLTAREKEILQWLSKGFQYKEIADKMYLSIETIRTYIRHIYEKLQVHTRTEALNKVYGK